MKILPTTFLAILFLGMLGLFLIAPGPILIPAPLNLLGVIPLGLGLFLAFQGSAQFRKVGTEINTFGEPDKLVTDGLFRYSRNPMYLGFLLLLLGTWILLGRLTAVLGVVIFLIVTDRFYIPYEEKMMAAHFGEAWMTYRAKVRRWV